MNPLDEELMTGEELFNHRYCQHVWEQANSPSRTQRLLAYCVLAPGALSIWATALVLGIIYLLTLIPAP